VPAAQLGQLALPTPEEVPALHRLQLLAAPGE
jgi:hypothetical protein